MILVDYVSISLKNWNIFWYNSNTWFGGVMKVKDHETGGKITSTENILLAKRANEARLLKPGSAGNDKLDEVQKEKTEFIRLNIDKYIRIALDREKADTDFRVGMCRRQLPPNYPNFPVGKFAIE